MAWPVRKRPHGGAGLTGFDFIDIPFEKTWMTARARKAGASMVIVVDRTGFKGSIWFCTLGVDLSVNRREMKKVIEEGRIISLQGITNK